MANSHGPGDVYVLVHPLSPWLVKIGMTRGTVAERVRALSGTSMPVPFVVVCFRRFADPKAAERKLHDRFANRRFRENREFFVVPVPEAVDALLETAAHERAIPSDDLETRTEILADLVSRHGSIIDSSISGAAIVQDSTFVWLETRRALGNNDWSIRRTDLDFIGDGGAESVFLSSYNTSRNVAEFLDLDPYTLLICTDLIGEAAAPEVDRQHNPNFVSGWGDLNS
jgi:hypothetical protein